MAMIFVLGCGFFENKTKNIFAAAAQHEIRVG
jgi:hypothetical protein